MRKNLITATLIAIALLLWLLSGALLNGGQTAPHPTLAEAGDTAAPETGQSLARVRARVIAAESRARVVVLRGRTQSKRSVDVKAEVAGRVTSRPVERGAQVKTGDLLCELAIDDREVSVAQAEASLEEARIEYEGSLRLKEQGLQSETAIAKTAARLEAARAEVRRKTLNLERIRIVAPYDGFVEMLHMNVGDYAARGSVCVTLIDLDPLLIVANVTEAEVEKMDLLGTISGRTSTGQDISGTLTFISKQSDPQTRTYPVEITVANPEFSLRSGLTSTVALELERVSAHLVSSALLVLNDAGEIGLRTVGADNQVEFHRIDIIEDGVDGVWVTGLPDPTHLIVVGQEFVHAGQTVEPLYPRASSQ